MRVGGKRIWHSDQFWIFLLVKLRTIIFRMKFINEQVPPDIGNLILRFMDFFSQNCFLSKHWNIVRGRGCETSQ